MTRRDDLKLSRGATAKARENAVKPGSCAGDQHFRHHPERPGFSRRAELTGGMGPRVIVQTIGPVNGHEPGEDPLEIPEFLRRVH